MKTITNLLALLILCCGMVASAVNHDASLENMNGLEGQQVHHYVDEQGNIVDADGNPVDALNSDDSFEMEDEDSDAQNVQNSLDNLVNMLTSDDKREMLKRIAQKMKTLFFHTEDSERGYITKIMEYINDITHVDNQPLIEELLKAWYTVMETGENKDLIRQVQTLLDVIDSNNHIQETMRVLHAGIENIYNDETALRLIAVSVKTAHKAVEMKENLRGIFQEAFDIVRDPNKVGFILNMAETIGPIMGTLKLMVGTEDFSQASPLMSTLPAMSPQMPFNPQSQMNRAQSFNNAQSQMNRAQSFNNAQSQMNRAQSFNNAQPQMNGQQSLKKPFVRANFIPALAPRAAQFQQPGMARQYNGRQN